MSKFGFNTADYAPLRLVSTAPAVEPVVDFSIFHSISCDRVSRLQKSWSEVCSMLREPDIIAHGKLSAPLLKMATFGEERNPNDQQPNLEKRSLRHTGNIQHVTGLEADYDDGVLSMDEAVRALEKAGIRAVLYSSWGDGLIEPPKYLGGPRWRILAPFSAPLTPDQRVKMVARLNGALGGVLADESFTLAQGFFIGARPGSDYKCKVTFSDPCGGAPIDTLTELDLIAVYKRTASAEDSSDETYGVEYKPGSVVAAPEVYDDLRSALAVIPADTNYSDWWRVLRGLSRLSDKYKAKALAREWSTSSDNPTHTAAAFEEKWRQVMRESSVINYQTIFYEAYRNDPQWRKEHSSALKEQHASLKTSELAAITMEELAQARLNPRVILPYMLYADVRTRISAGGTGKTTVALYEAITLALGAELWGRTPDQPVRTVIVTREDTREILVARAREIMVALNLDRTDVAQVLSNLLIVDLSGVSFRISQVDGDVVVPHTKNLNWIIELLGEFKPDWMIMDPLVSFGVGEQRVNDAEQGLIEAMRILRAEFDCCVEGIHHSGKANAREKTLDQYSGRGGSSLADGARMVCVMQPLTPQEWSDATGGYLEEGSTGIVMAMPKMSYCRTQDPIYIVRKGYLFTQVLPLAQPSQTELQKEQDATVYGVVKEAWLRNQPLTPQELKDDYKALFYGNLKRDAALEALGRLKRDGHVVQNASRGGRGQRSVLEPIILEADQMSKYAISKEPC